MISKRCTSKVLVLSSGLRIRGGGQRLSNHQYNNNHINQLINNNVNRNNIINNIKSSSSPSLSSYNRYYSNSSNDGKSSNEYNQKNEKEEDDEEEEDPQQMEWRLWGKDRGIDNIMAWILGISISGISFASFGLYLVEDSNQDKLQYLTNLLNYFWWAPPIGLWNHTGELVDYIEQFKLDTLSVTGVKLLYNISTYQRGRELLYKKGVFDILVQRMSRIGDVEIETGTKAGRDYLTSVEYQLSMLFQLSIHCGIDVPDATKRQIIELKRRYPEIKLQDPYNSEFFIERSQLLSHMQAMYERPVGVNGIFVYGLVGGLYAFLKVRKLPHRMLVMPTAVISTAAASMLVAGIHTYRRFTNDSIISRSTTYNDFVARVEGCSIFYSTALLSIAGLPLVYWIVPTISTYILISTYQAYNIYKTLKQDVEKELRKQDWKNNK